MYRYWTHIIYSCVTKFWSRLLINNLLFHEFWKKIGCNEFSFSSHGLSITSFIMPSFLSHNFLSTLLFFFLRRLAMAEWDLPSLPLFLECSSLASIRLSSMLLRRSVISFKHVLPNLAAERIIKTSLFVESLQSSSPTS